MQDLKSRVLAIIASQLPTVDSSRIIPSASFSDDLHTDSLAKLEVIMALEEVFGIDIPDDDAERIVTVQDAIDYVAREWQRESE
jgi:acyl carrier protein